jgi:hypothetical protein
MADIVYGVAHLEQVCIAPGHWVIEAWTVRRRRRCWTVARFPTDPTTTVRTLREAREWIADQS